MTSRMCSLLKFRLSLKMEPSPRYTERLMSQALDAKYAKLKTAYAAGDALPNWENLNEECVYYRQFLDPRDSKTFNDAVLRAVPFVPYITENKYTKTIDELHMFWRRIMRYEIAFGAISDAPSVEYLRVHDCFRHR